MSTTSTLTQTLDPRPPAAKPPVVASRKKAGKGKAKHKSEEDDGDAKKAGNPGKFHGAPLAFLEGQLPIYLSCKGRGAVTDFYAKMFGVWWTTFPWWEGYGPDGHPLPEELITAPSRAANSTVDELLDSLGPSSVDTQANPDVSAVPTVHDASAVPDVFAVPAVPDASAVSAVEENGSAAQPEVSTLYASTGGVNPLYKDIIKAEITTQLKNWFSYRKQAANRASKNPFLDWLEGFKRPPPAPRKLPLHKYYMQHEDYSESVEERFTDTWEAADLEQRFALDFRCKIAKELLDEESPAAREALIAEQNTEHDEAMAEYQTRADRVANPDTPDAEKMEACRANLAQVVQPFLDGISKLTGFSVTLLAGAGPPKDSERFVLTALHAGRTISIGGVQGQTLVEWDRDGFRKVIMAHFMKFLLETNEHSATRIVPGTGTAWATEPNALAASASSTMDVDSPAPCPDTEMAPAPPVPAATTTAEPEPTAPVNAGGRRGRRREHAASTENETPSPTVSRTSSRSRESSPVVPSSPEMRRSRTPALRTGCIPGPELRQELDAMATPQRHNRMAELALLSRYEFDIESNKARNRALMAALDLHHAGTSVFGPSQAPSRPQPRPRPRSENTGPRRTSSRLAAQAPAGEEQEDQEQEEEERREDEGERHEEGEEERHEEEERLEGKKEAGDATENAAKGERSTHQDEHTVENVDGATTMDMSTWPKWMRDGHTLLSAFPQGGSEWETAVGTWVALEKTYGFKSSSAALDTARRPSEVGQWIKYGRSTTRQTEVKSIEALEGKWWDWWSDLAPSWREKDDSGKPIIGEELGTWGELVHPGANGMLVVLLPLVWWGMGEGTDEASGSLAAAIHDISWVLQRLLLAAKTQKRKAPEMAAEGSQEPASKCARRTRR